MRKGERKGGRGVRGDKEGLGSNGSVCDEKERRGKKARTSMNREDEARRSKNRKGAQGWQEEERRGKKKQRNE